MNPPQRPMALWRLRTLAFLRRSHSVFFLEAYMVEDYLIDIIVSSQDFSYAVTTAPWSISLGRCVPLEEFRKYTRPPPDQNELNEILRRPKVDFNPKRLIRLLLANCEERPVIVSSDFARVIGNRRKKSLLEHIACDKIYPGIQACHHRPSCIQPVVAISVNGGDRGSTFYCSKHALAVDDTRLKILLYRPMLVSVAAHDKNIVTSVMDIDDLFGQTHTSHPNIEVSVGTVPIPRPMLWTPIAKLSQPREPISKRLVSRLCETADNIGLFPSRGCEIHGAAFTHSLVSRLFKKTLESSQWPCRLEPSSQEDTPYNWELFH